MKNKVYLSVFFALLVLFGVVWNAAAQEPPTHNRLWEQSEVANPEQPVEPQSVEAFTLGQPSTVFRYVQTFGVTENAYIADTTHINYPYFGTMIVVIIGFWFLTAPELSSVRLELRA